MATKKEVKPISQPEIKRVKIDDFMNGDVKDFARYCVETRACPKLSDGQRSGARKIIYAALTGDLSKRKFIKTVALGGDVMKMEYHHGDASLYNTIVQLGSDYLNRCKPLQIQGQVPYIRDTSIEVAPRYLSVGKSEYMFMYEQDKELWDIQEEEGEKVEPVTLYPIIPTVLLYRTNSPGFGFSFRSFSYTIDSIIDNCIHSIFDGSCSDRMFQLKPDVVGYNNNNFIYNYQKESWYSLGDFTCDFENDILTVTDLPFNVQFEAYENHLTDLKERMKIRDFSNLSSGDNVKYIIKFRTNDLKMYFRDKWKFFQMFKLFSKVKPDILNVITEHNNISHYDDAYYFIDAFVKYRLKIYERRKVNTIKILKDEIDELEKAIKFIKLVIEHKIVIEKRKLADVYTDMDKYDLPHKLVNLPVSKLTEDEIKKHEAKIAEKKEYLDYILNTTIQEMYLKELIELKEKLTKNVIDMTNVL